MNNISNYALDSAASIIKDHYGDLSDMPKELANTICNVYYLPFLLLEQGKPTKLLSAYMDIPKEGFFESLKPWLEIQSRSTTNIQFIKQEILALRQMKIATQDSSLSSNEKYKATAIYNFCVELTLDTYKYNIEDADKKTKIRRSIERKLKSPREIPNLVEIMNNAGHYIYNNSI